MYTAPSISRVAYAITLDADITNICEASSHPPLFSWPTKLRLVLLNITGGDGGSLAHLLLSSISLDSSLASKEKHRFCPRGLVLCLLSIKKSWIGSVRAETICRRLSECLDKYFFFFDRLSLSNPILCAKDPLCILTAHIHLYVRSQ